MSESVTLRDLFAAHALTGYLAAHASEETALPTRDEAAEYAFKMADAMLLARQPKPQTTTTEDN